jgi:DNA-binding IclR family transcriptional regulator
MEPSFLEEIILGILKQSDSSLTILEIAERTRIHRVTASKYLAVLEAKGFVKRRDVGKAKLYSLGSVKVLQNPDMVFLNGRGGSGHE